MPLENIRAAEGITFRSSSVTTFNNLPSLAPANISSSPSTCTITDDVYLVSGTSTIGVDDCSSPLSTSRSRVMNNKLQTCVYIKEMKYTLDNVQNIYAI